MRHRPAGRRSKFTLTVRRADRLDGLTRIEVSRPWCIDCRAAMYFCGLVGRKQPLQFICLNCPPKFDIDADPKTIAAQYFRASRWWPGESRFERVLTVLALSECEEREIRFLARHSVIADPDTFVYFRKRVAEEFDRLVQFERMLHGHGV
jgi:hypothetical protein